LESGACSNYLPSAHNNSKTAYVPSSDALRPVSNVSCGKIISRSTPAFNSAPSTPLQAHHALADVVSASAWHRKVTHVWGGAHPVATIAVAKSPSHHQTVGWWSASRRSSTAFLAAHGEIFGTFSKIRPFLAELRTARGKPGMAEHLEKVVMSAPCAEAILKRRREALRAFYAIRQEKSQAAG